MIKLTKNQNSFLPLQEFSTIQHMFTSRIPFIFSVVFIFIATTLSAQDKDDLGTEVVNIVKPYTPTISDAFKVKETPVLNDSVSLQKQPVS